MVPKVAVIVLCYNGIDLTVKCLESLLNQDYPNKDVIIVDNCSSDGTVPTVAERFPQVKIIQNFENLGYALGNNCGIAYALKASAEAVFLVNNDTRLEKSCLSKLMVSLSYQPKVGIVGPKVYTWDRSRTLSSAGGIVNWKMANAINVGMGETDTGQYTRRSVDFINGCGILISKDAIQHVSGFDPKFFMYWEETDLCLRVKEAGFEVHFEPAAEMDHKAPINSPELSPTTLYYMSRNRFLFFGRHARGSMKLISLARALKGTLSGIRKNQRDGRYHHAKAMQYALAHAMIGRWGYANPELWMSENRA